MKKIFLILLSFSFLIWSGCDPETPTTPKLETTRSQAALTKMVAVGNSLTAGFQSSGLKESFQLNNYPYLIAQQMGMATDFQQPLISEPGIGSPAGKTPQSFNPTTGAITQDDLTVNPLLLLKNAYLSRPYDNLGVPGADLNDALNTTSSVDNPFFDLVLRNPNFGNTTMLEQAISLQPTLLLLWLGSNDVLGAALEGGGVNGSLLGSLITSQNDFQTRLTSVLTQIRMELTSTLIVMANIPNVTDIPYVNFMDITFQTIPALGINDPVPVLFDETFQPVDFDPSDGVLYLPLWTEESTLNNVLLTGLLAYQSGYGIPDSAHLRDLGFSSAEAQAFVAGMAPKLISNHMPIPGTMTLTTDEATQIANAVTGFNQIIASPQLQGTFVYLIVDANSLLNQLNTTGLDGLSGDFVFLAPTTTAFSLDGVHPNNAGHALVANAFINTINAALQLSIPTLTISEYAGQYMGKRPAAESLKSSLDGVRAIFRK
jgi:lysophospholipase L1-like esterase